MKKKIESFFIGVEDIWSVIPGYLKVFLYSVSSSVFGLWVLGTLDWRAVVIIVAANIGIYQAPRSISTGVTKIMK